MKSFLVLAMSLIMAASFIVLPEYSNAQIVKELTPAAADDTLTNADTAYVYISAGLGSNASAIAEANGISVAARLTRLSGTAAGSVALQGSVDGTNWEQIDTDNFTNAVTNHFVYSLRGASGDLLYKQYRLVFITSGTVSAIPKGYYLRRNR